ncbi:MAG TPA: hypothetical protein PKO06_15515 [Candidatus Ozemobacteraceae bacterium]|nr:hypothetical protein [Candidatus Ozemobacteraceae bacterium]
MLQERSQRRGLSVVELVFGFTIFALLLLIAGRLISSANRQTDVVSGYATFHLNAGRLIEAMKLDLRSAIEIDVGTASLQIERVLGVASDGQILRETVSYAEAGTHVQERRAGRDRAHILCPDSKSVTRIRLQFEVAHRHEELGEPRGLLKLTVSAFSSDFEAHERYVASAAVEIKPRVLRP